MAFLPDAFDPPRSLETPHFRLRPLTIHDVVKDFEAVVSSAGHLQGVFGPGSTWPQGLTLEQNLIDLGWHQKEFQRRSSLAYTVVRPDESQVIGCVYLYPCQHPGYDAQMICWVRASLLPAGYDARLFEAVRQWLDADWPFQRVAFPGREIPWEDWPG